MQLENLREYRRMIESVSKDYDDAKKKFIEEHCQYKEGDIRTITGYSYQGKKMIIRSVGIKEVPRYRKSATGYAWIFRGKVLKNDGTVGIRNVHDNEDIPETPDTI